MGGQCVFVENQTNYDHIRTCFEYVQWWNDAGPAGGSGVGKYSILTMPRAQNRAVKSFNSITKAIPFAHLGILFIYGHTP